MQKALARLYPAQDKISVFIMACLLLALFAFQADARDSVIGAFLAWHRTDPFEAAITAGLLIAGFVSALTFPFLRHDFRGLALLVLGVNALALLIGNARMAYQADSMLELGVSLVFAAYFAGWFAAIKNYPREQLIEARDPQRSEALFAAALCAVLLTGGLLLGMDWFAAYSLAVAIAPGVHIAIRRRVVHSGLIREER